MQSNKEYFYSHARIFGAATFIVLSLVTGPLTGYVIGAFLVVKLSWPSYTPFIGAGLGFVFSITEVIKIVKFLMKKEK